MPFLGNRVNDMRDGFAFVHTSDEVLFQSPLDLPGKKQKACQLLRCEYRPDISAL
jgi:hypothetical protein